MKEWKSNAFGAVIVLLLVAFVAHLAWTLLQPLVPVLIMLAALWVVYGLLLRRRR